MWVIALLMLNGSTFGHLISYHPLAWSHPISIEVAFTKFYMYAVSELSGPVVTAHVFNSTRYRPEITPDTGRKYHQIQARNVLLMRNNTCYRPEMFF
jgi:hypothetical protein